MSRRNRPSAFEVSFPEEAEAYRAMVPSAGTSRSQSVVSGTSSVPAKRKNGEEGASRKTVKERPLPPVAHYRPPTKPEDLPQKETHDLLLPGEDGDPDDTDAEGDGSTRPNADSKPMRVLRNFTIFDSLHQNELVSLGFIETSEGIGREIVVVGYAKAHVDGEESEDEGQEDGLGEGEYVHLELSELWKYEMDYGKWDDPVYILTEYAWYILDTPAPAYTPFWEHFLSPKRVAQMVVSTALDRPADRPERFLETFTNKVDPFGHTYQEEDLDNAVPEIYEVVLAHPKYDSLVRTPLIQSVLKGLLSSAQKKPRVANTATTHRQIPASRLIGNPDLSVMKSENQNATQVTPFIYSLARGLVNETLQVVGPPPPVPDKNEMHRNKMKRYKRVKELLDKARKKKKDVRWDKDDKVRNRSGYLKRVYVEGEPYNVGDVILLPNDHPFWDEVGRCEGPLEVPHDVKLHDFFWFAVIHYLDIHAGTAHIQWFEHGSGILLRELADDQQLFLTPDCHTAVEFSAFLGKVEVEWNAPSSGSDDMKSKPKPVDFDRFVCNYMFDKGTGAFYDIPSSELSIPKTLKPPQNCPSCLRQEQRDHENECKVTKDDQGIENGFTCRGHKYHYEDFVLFYADEGPAKIGYITNVDVVTSGGKWSMDRSFVTVKKVGRIGDLGAILPADVVRDERHLFLTDETVRVNVNELLGVVFVPTVDSLQDVMKLEEWVSLSPDHFYIKYQFPNMRPRNWNERKRLKWQKHHVCAPCWQDKLREVKGLKEFLKDKKRHPLNTLDLFGGVGAFSDSLRQGSGALRITHAIEIMPSAAKTFKRNHPKTVVYNQCANTMLKYMIKWWNGMEVQEPYQLYDEKQPVPLPPKKGEIQVITAGFPCQAHSSLNMFKDANDVKNNLVLNALSWIDAVRPIFAFFENVTGFLSHRLNATQASVHKVEGGIEMGGLKIMVRALLDMGYQVRFSLLQAAQYGTPQRRVRFFCIAAQQGHPLPEIPQPSHDFVDTGLEIKLPYSVDSSYKQNMRPVHVKKGTTLHRTVCLDDAIGDLPRFDWKHPSGRDAVRYEHGKRITAVECKKTKPHCGLSNPVPPYHHEPKTRFQVEARVKPPTNLQHFTKCLAPKRVARVIAIPMEANADYRRLEAANQEWQLANPHSYTARNGYKPGAYGRLDKNGVFATIVTNVDPTAKQSRVLNPYCKRMVTVRELARGQGFPDHFVFESHQNAITSIHRQIGNAVPYPLGRALGRELRASLFKKWTERLQEGPNADEDDDAMDVDR